MRRTIIVKRKRCRKSASGWKEANEYFIDGKRVSKKAFEKAAPPKGVSDGDSFGVETNWSKPIVSYALAVHPKQVKEAREDAVKKGVPTDYLDDGRPVFRSRKHRKDYFRAYGFYDRDAGIGDAGRHSYSGHQEPGTERQGEQY